MQEPAPNNPPKGRRAGGVGIYPPKVFGGLRFDKGLTHDLVTNRTGSSATAVGMAQLSEDSHDAPVAVNLYGLPGLDELAGRANIHHSGDTVLAGYNTAVGK